MLTPQAFLTMKKVMLAQIEFIQGQLSKLESQAHKAKVPKHLRPAAPADIVEGNVLWMIVDDGWMWMDVQEVLRPEDDFKAFMYDGARYGLHRAFVEIDRTPTSLEKQARDEAWAKHLESVREFKALSKRVGL